MSDVTLQKVQVLGIERFEIAIEEPGGKRSVERLFRVMDLLKKSGGQKGDAPIELAGLKFKLRLGTGGFLGAGKRSLAK